MKENHTQYFPAFFNLDGQRVLVVGSGEVAKRKLALLMRTGARITLVAPQILPELEAGAARGELRLLMRDFEPAELDGMRLVIVATSRRAINRWIATLCEACGLPVNVVDDRDRVTLPCRCHGQQCRDLECTAWLGNPAHLDGPTPPHAPRISA